MKPLKKKTIEIFSNGSLSFSFINCSLGLKKTIKIYKKDNKNCILNKKNQIFKKTKSDLSVFYKKKYYV